jgi:hypothetical protein
VGQSVGLIKPTHRYRQRLEKDWELTTAAFLRDKITSDQKRRKHRHTYH